mgnify:CR=1 FL=1|tara:strand:- start:1792 stop:2463 length:672 start_codon:yes stop_codon:yes gene_type:complete
MRKEIIHPIFTQCRKFCDDNFWANIFEDLAYGKTPYGSYISKNFLCCNFKKKDFAYKIDPTKNPEQMYKEIFFLFTNKLGIISNEEKLKQKQMFINMEKDLKDSRKNWNNIKKKNIKELLIELYVIRIKKKFNLSNIQAKYLLSLFYMGIIFKMITSKDIIYQNGQIQHINGIDFVRQQILIGKDFYNLEKDCSPNIILYEKNLMKDNWDKYIKDMRKNNIFS